MAITIHIFYSGKPGMAKAFIQDMIEQGVVDAIRKEDGNLRYEYFIPIEDDNTVLLIDSWKDQKSLDIHHASPMMTSIMNLREKYNLSMKAERYISDDDSFTENDKKFMNDQDK